MDFELTKKGARRALLASLSGVLIMCGLAIGGDWPNWRGGNYDGISNETGWNTDWPQEGPKVLWEKQIGIGFSAVSVANGKAYVTGNADNKDTVFCFDTATGNEIWKKSYDQRLDPKYYEGGTLATPTIADGKVYYISKDGKTFCFDADTGNIDWEKDLDKEYGFKRTTWGYSSSPLVIEDIVILNVGRAGLALKKKDGSFVWGGDKTPGGYATMVPYTTDGTKCVAMFGFKEIIGLEAATGKQLWTHTWETKHDINAADPIIDGDKIFIASGYDRGCAMLQISGREVTELWKNDNLRCKMSGPVLIDGALYGPHQSKGLQCLDAATGNLLWEQKEFKQGCVTAAGGKLIVISQKGKLAVANPSKEKYDEISSAQVLTGRCWTVPVLANGRIYVRNAKGTLKCLDVSGKGKAPGSEKKVSGAYWPQWQGPLKDAKSTDTGLLKKWPEGGPKMLWSVDGIGAGYSSVTIADGLIYISGMIGKEGFITAVEIDGTVKWRKPYSLEWSKSYPGARSSVTIDNGKLYIFSGTGVASCLDAKSGEKIWSVDVKEKFEGRHLHWGYGESPLVVDDKVICTAGGEGASIVALNVNDGSVVWKEQTLDDPAAYCSPIVVDRGGKKMIIQVLQTHVVGVNAADGSVMCKYDTNDYQFSDQGFGDGCHTNTPVYDDGFIYLTSGYDRGSGKLKISEDGTEITKVWANEDLDVHHGGVILVDGHIYGANWLSNSKGKWLCVDWKTGQTKYQQDWNGRKGSIGYADGMLYCYQEKGGILALVKPTPEKFEISSSFEITMGEDEHWAHPVICGGVLYMRHGDVLMAYNVKEKS